MNRNLLYAALFVAAVGGYLYLHKKSQNAANPQQPAADAQQNYTVPPDIGAQVDSTGGLNFPGGIPDGTTVSMTQAQAMPLPVGTSPTSGNT